MYELVSPAAEGWWSGVARRTGCPVVVLELNASLVVSRGAFPDAERAGWQHGRVRGFGVLRERRRDCVKTSMSRAATNTEGWQTVERHPAVVDNRVGGGTSVRHVRLGSGCAVSAREQFPPLAPEAPAEYADLYSQVHRSPCSLIRWSIRRRRTANRRIQTGIRGSFGGLLTPVLRRERRAERSDAVCSRGGRWWCEQEQSV